MPRRGWRSVTLQEKVYLALRRLALEKGFSSLSDAVAHLLELERVIAEMKTPASPYRYGTREGCIDYEKALCTLLEKALKLANKHALDEEAREVFSLWEELSPRCA